MYVCSGSTLILHYPLYDGDWFVAIFVCVHSKTCVKRPPQKDNKLVFKTNYRLMQVKSIAECSKGDYSAILLTFIKLPFVIEIFNLYVFEWLFIQVLLYLVCGSSLVVILLLTRCFCCSHCLLGLCVLSLFCCAVCSVFF